MTDASSAEPRAIKYNSRSRHHHPFFIGRDDCLSADIFCGTFVFLERMYGTQRVYCESISKYTLSLTDTHGVISKQLKVPLLVYILVITDFACHARYHCIDMPERTCNRRKKESEHHQKGHWKGDMSEKDNECIWSRCVHTVAPWSLCYYFAENSPIFVSEIEVQLALSESLQHHEHTHQIVLDAIPWSNSFRVRSTPNHRESIDRDRQIFSLH